MSDDALIVYARKIKMLEAKLEIAVKRLETMPQIMTEGLLELSAWMGIPEKNRQSAISEIVSNINYIVQKTLAQIKGAVEEGE